MFDASCAAAEPIITLSPRLAPLCAVSRFLPAETPMSTLSVEEPTFSPA